jgi:hypothetical protein
MVFKPGNYSKQLETPDANSRIILLVIALVVSITVLVISLGRFLQAAPVRLYVPRLDILQIITHFQALCDLLLARQQPRIKWGQFTTLTSLHAASRFIDFPFCIFLAGNRRNLAPPL